MKLFAVFFFQDFWKKNRNKKAREKNTNVNNKPQQMDLKRKEFFKSISVQKQNTEKNFMSCSYVKTI